MRFFCLLLLWACAAQAQVALRVDALGLRAEHELGRGEGVALRNNRGEHCRHGHGRRRDDRAAGAVGGIAGGSETVIGGNLGI